jgi:hypothetical protein
MPAPYAGGCLCGAIRYRLDAEPLSLYACHCRDCQRLTGSAFALSMPVARDALATLSGEPRAYDVAMPGGRRKHGRFCGACSTRLWGEPARFPKIRILRPGTLDDTSWLRPVGSIWTRSAQPWVAALAGAFDHAEQPEDPLALIRAWQGRAQQQ